MKTLTGSILSRIVFSLLILLAAGTAGERTYGNATIKHLEYVIDGDTFVVSLTAAYPRIIGDSVHVRIYGVNTPEIHSPDSAAHAQAVKAWNFAESKLRSAKRITLVNMGRDKYFRILATVRCDTLNLGAALIRAGLAVPYFGGTK